MPLRKRKRQSPEPEDTQATLRSIPQRIESSPEPAQEEQEVVVEQQLATPTAAAAGGDGHNEGEDGLVVPVLSDVGKLLLEDIMNHEGDDPEDIIKAMETLFNSMNIYNQIKVDALELGGHVIIISKMKKFVTNHCIQYYGCACLAYLALESSCIRWIVKAGGVEAIINAMKIHDDTDCVLGAGLSALSSLTFPSITQEGIIIDDVIDKLVSQYHIVSIVDEAMKKFPEDTYLQGKGCQLLYSLSKNQAILTKYKNRFMKVVGTVGTALASHGCSDQVVEGNNRNAVDVDDDDILEYGGGFMKRLFSRRT